ncbi:hypothetical protein AB0F72_34915 [Actinoplanes sp. NPDC023936]
MTVTRNDGVVMRGGLTDCDMQAVMDRTYGWFGTYSWLFLAHLK